MIRHRKLRELALSLRLSPVYALGHLHVLWHAALEQQEDGDLAAWSDEFITESAAYPGDAPQFVRLLQQHGWFDGKLIHDWLDYAGRYLESKYRTADPTKLVRIWAKHGRVWPESGFSRTKDSPPTLPNPDNLTQKETKRLPANGAGPKVSKPAKAATTPFWKETIDRMDKTWLEKRKVPFYWRARYFKSLQRLVSLYQPWGVVSLWSTYLGLNDSFVKNAGYSFEMFEAKIPSLVDDPSWKSSAKRVETEFCSGPPPELISLLSKTVPNNSLIKKAVS